ncbi:uncharacterized protein LOC111252070 isoform X3 [Varroa destructor]|uniref:Uncharacterized protein n=1 Tax=Varroa destructor TaxID=109461 RepID=A0A7M7KDF8_VARDE|nr:uncharacterized protein LOC111252070 isoform X3 [Varroa destructor]
MPGLLEMRMVYSTCGTNKTWLEHMVAIQEASFKIYLQPKKERSCLGEKSSSVVISSNFGHKATVTVTMDIRGNHNYVLAENKHSLLSRAFQEVHGQLARQSKARNLVTTSDLVATLQLLSGLSKDMCGTILLNALQVGKLSCGHQICGACFRGAQSTVEKCYLCILNAAELNRSNMRVISAASSDAETLQGLDKDDGKEIERAKENLFCINDGCDFIGSSVELAPHREHCKFRLLSGYDSESLELSVASSMENAANSKRQLTLIGLSKQMDDVTERLNAVTKKLENWQRTNGRENHEGTQKTAEGGYKAKAELFRNGFFEIALTAMITAFIVHWYSVNRDFSVVRENEGIAAQSLASGPRGIAFSFSGIDELIAKARFNKRDMLISKPIRMEQYKVKLGFGGSLSPDGNEVNLWVSAIINKNDDNDWPVGEVLRLALEHPDPERRRSYDFLSDHAGTWKENIRVHKGKLVFRQMQVETTKTTKYLRFSCLLTYEEALAAGGEAIVTS